ncbi:response regulator [Pontibacillus yanchengensis]|uniref:Response regulator n=1 Tax=Pontibacillus yanchengensis TaxID=462910 RepID=A0ACC7VGY0_9BACI|nr:response regulator [Pontibacillus yanchengensis]MYL53962.1 response regulator [Pontibacillus yanchengensis]
MILVIDDNVDIRFTISEICEFGGWSIEECSNGKMGVATYDPGKHDLVMVDYHMPEWDGLQTVRELRKIDAHVPIIVLTVDERMELATQFTEAGATDFAQKPIKAADLISRIKLNLKMAKMQDDTQTAFVEKGINEETLRQIKRHLNQQTEPKTINQIQKDLPVSYQTVHRYLNYLVDMGEVEIQANYGNKGRPKNTYKII